MKRIITGILIIMLGAFLILNKMGFFIPQVYSIVMSWQTLVVAVGLILLFDRKQDHKTAGLVLILIGTLFSLNKIIHTVSMSGFIVPIVLIIIGIAFIIKASTRRNLTIDHETWCDENSNWKKHFTEFGKKFSTNEGGVVKKEYVFAGSREKWTQGKLKNLEIEAVFSGVELDFTQAELADDIKVAAHIKVTSVFSGITLYVPEDWNIMVQKTGVFGGFNDSRPNRVLKVSSDKLVVLELEAVFGGGEIKCYE